MILIADDNEADARLIIEALRENGLKEQCVVARDGEEVMKLLRRLRLSGGLPRLLVLDINMPKKDGLAVLKEIKGDPGLRMFPVIMMTTSDDDKDIVTSYQLHANSYITKPLCMDRFVEVVGQLHAYWFGVAQLPSGSC